MSRDLSTFASLAMVAAFAPALSASAQARPASPATHSRAPHIFGTIALPLKSTRFDHRWQHVMRRGTGAGQLTSLVRAARSAPQMEQLRLVNASLNGLIRYRHDGLPGDRWSTARETLARAAGDCEDYAIVKLQALKALGVPESDLFMTIGHDGALGAVHAVLVARSGGRYFVLDNRTNRLVPHEQFRDFYPMITFGARSSWLHGYARGKTPAAVRQIDHSLRSNRELPLGDSRGSIGPRDSLLGNSNAMSFIVIGKGSQ